MSEPNKPAVPQLDTSTRLAVDRTLLALDRNMMAWTRTAASLITFGFAIDRFFEIQRPSGWQHPHFIGARQFAVMLICIGLVSLLLATLGHRRSLKEMLARYGGVPSRTPAGVTAALVSILGIAALLASLLRL